MKKASGFTLVEIAVVLIIIGLLLGGVLKGQELIVQAKIRNAVTDLNGVTAAYYAYQDRYRQIPGDDRNAADRWPAVGTIPAAGNGDGSRGVGQAAPNALAAAAGCASSDSGENCIFWNHLRRSGLILGDLGSAESPLNSSGGYLHVQADAFGLRGFFICTTNLSGKIAGAIDRQVDDGNPRSGTTQAGLGTATNTPLTQDHYTEDGASVYTLCKQI